MIKNIITKSLLISMTFIFAIACSAKKVKSENTLKVGIVQIVAHPALDKAKNGFMDYFKEKNVNVSFIEQNANGEMSSANLIANNFVNEKVNLIYAIATPSAQAALNATKDIPIVFSAVTDYVSAGLIGKNISGVSDFVDIKKQLELLKDMDPTVKTISFLYNSSEANSAIQLENFKKATTELGYKYEVKSVTQANEIPQAVTYLVNKSDAIYTPTDNLIASMLPVIANAFIDAKKVVIGAEAAHVDAGALYTKGIDYYELGRKAGEMAYEVLINKKDISSFKVETLELNDVKINNETLQKLNK